MIIKFSSLFLYAKSKIVNLTDLKISLHVKNETIYTLISLDNSKH